MIFDKYPYTNFHEMNDDWIIQTLREFGQLLDEFVVANSLTYADPIAYDPATTYPANTVVIHHGTAYVSLKTAPAGIEPGADNTSEYWLEIFPFGDMIRELIDSDIDDLEGHIDEVMPSLVNAWMAEHPDVTTTVPINSIMYQKLHTSLQDILLNGYITDESAETIASSAFVQGNISFETGEELPATDTCRTNFLTFGDCVVKFAALGGYAANVYEYDTNGVYLNKHNTVTGPQTSAFLALSDHKYRVTIVNLNGDMAPADIPFGAIVYQRYYSDQNDLTTYTGCEKITFSRGFIKTATVGNTADLTVLNDDTTVCAAVPCIAGEMFNISGMPLNLSSKRPIMFVDNNNVSAVVLVQSQVFAEEVVAPVSGTLVINLSNASDHYAYRNKIRLAQWIQTALNGLTGMIPQNYLRQLATGSTESNVAYTLANTNGVSQNGYDTETYAVAPGEILIASGLIPASLSYYFALFYDAAGKFIGYHNRVNGQSKYVDEPIICPPNCATVKFTHARSNVLRVYRIYADSSTRKRVTREGDVIKICDGTYTLWMSKHGNNNLMDLQYIRKGDTNLHTVGSDWQGPYVVSANQNADGDAIAQGPAYTGGNHAYASNGQSGTPTARTVSFKVVVDGVELEDGGDLDWSDYVEISWVNRVQAWNTKKSDGTGREVLEEQPIWTFRPHGKVQVQNTVRALEPITVTTYYGMQMTAAWVSRGIFIPDATRHIAAVSDIVTSYGSSFDGSVINAYEANINIGMEIDTAFDLGSGSCLGALKRIHITSSKVYFQTINSTSFDANDYFAYKGAYTFIAP